MKAAEKSPRIVVDLRPLQTGYAGRGIGRCTRELASRIARQRGDVKSLVFGSRPNPMPEIPVLISAPIWNRPWLWDQLALPLHLKLKKVALFHSFVGLGPLHEISFPVLAARYCIVTVYDMHMFEHHADDQNRFYRKTARIRIQKAGLPNVFKCLVISPQTRERVLFHTSIRPEKILDIPLGCDHMDPFISQEPADSRASASLPLVLSVGDTPNKNLALAWRVLNEIRPGFPELQWIICGKRSRIESQIPLEDGSQGWIQIMEEPTDRELAAVYTRASFLFFPSSEEGFGLPVIEAMRLGCPVITGNNEPLKTLSGYDSGLDPSDKSEKSVGLWVEACRTVLTDSARSREMIAQGKKQAAGFTWSGATDKILEQYRIFFEKSDNH